MIVHVLKNWLKSSSRNGRSVTGIILHATAGHSAESSISWLKRDGVDASYHYIIEDDGVITKCVPTSRKAWHAGKSFGPEGNDVNPCTIGIAFANINDGREPYTDAQLNACAVLIGVLKDAFPLTWIATHHGVAPTRKNDPKGFDLPTFSRRVGLNQYRVNSGARWIP